MVLEAQYQASLSSAVNKINTHRKEVGIRTELSTRGVHGTKGAARGQHEHLSRRDARTAMYRLTASPLLTLILPQVCVELSGYLLEELRDAKNFEAFKKDVATGGLRCRAAAPAPASAPAAASTCIEDR